MTWTRWTLKVAQFRNVIFAAMIAASLVTAPALADSLQRFTLDNSQSAVTARVAFFGIASKSAEFPEVSGSIRLNPDQLATIDLIVTMNAKALKAGDSVTLGRLRGPNFFDVDHHPTIRFVGQTMRMTGARSAEVDGELTARGVARREVLRVVFDRDRSAITGNAPITITGTMTINRRDYGMTAYSLIVGNRVTITIRARMVPG
jgi:polyisoprenoid-binding protein YceI